MRGKFLPKAITTIVVLLLILMMINKPAESAGIVSGTFTWLSGTADNITTFLGGIG